MTPTFQPRRAFAAAGAALALGALAGAPAAADSHDDGARGVERALPPANMERWTHHPSPSATEGAVAQINARGEGRFAVACDRGDDKGRIIYRTPASARDEVRAQGDSLSATFIFDERDEVTRENMSWESEGRYWVGPFGQDSRLAELLRRSYDVRITVDGMPGVESEFTLDGSWRAIEAMFASCRG